MVIALGLVVFLSVLWSDLHFLLAVFRAGQWWDLFPLVGMGILTYCLGWIAVKDRYLP